jgi:hypothetical protein
MPDQMTKTFGVDTDLAVLEGRKNQHMYGAESNAACKSAAVQELVIQLQRSKALKAMDCVTQVHQYGVDRISQFSAGFHSTLEQVVRSPSDQNYVEANIGPLTALHTQAITEVAGFADANIIAELRMPISTTPPWKLPWRR